MQMAGRAPHNSSNSTTSSCSWHRSLKRRFSDEFLASMKYALLTRVECQEIRQSYIIAKCDGLADVSRSYLIPPAARRRATADGRSRYRRPSSWSGRGLSSCRSADIGEPAIRRYTNLLADSKWHQLTIGAKIRVEGLDLGDRYCSPRCRSCERRHSVACIIRCDGVRSAGLREAENGMRRDIAVSQRWV